MEKVCWKFIAISAIYCLDLSSDGVLVYSETFETDDPSAYIYKTQQREYYANNEII